MPSSSQWVAFLIASILFIQVPGPSLLFTIGRALTVGRREALLSVVGNALGVIAQVACVAVGLGAIVAASATAYTAVKIAGAAYVVWLGVQAIRHRSDARLAMDSRRAAAAWPPGADRVHCRRDQPQDDRLLRGLPAAVHRPRRARRRCRRSCSGWSSASLAVASDSIWALAAGGRAHWFARRPQRLDALSAGGGTMMIGLGATMLTVD